MIYIVILFALAMGTTAIAEKLKKPYPIALVLVGAAIGLLHIQIFAGTISYFVANGTFQTIILAVFLPALIGEASLKLPLARIKADLKPILRLALLGTLISYFVIGTLGKLALGLPLQAAFTLAALLAATDPISVISLFKRLGVNPRFSLIVEAESLANDGVAIVLFQMTVFSFALLFSGAAGIALGLGMFLKIVLGGLVIGGLLGFLTTKLGQLLDNLPVENALSVLLFYGVYFIANALGVSGVMAVAAAGLVLGNYGAKSARDLKAYESVNIFWDTVALIANSMVFILVGLEIAAIPLGGWVGPIMLAVMAVIIARSIAVYLSTTGAGIPLWWRHIFNWGGVRGSLSLALALSLPAGFPDRQAITVLAFGVVLFSLLVQGLTIEPLVAYVGKKSAN